MACTNTNRAKRAAGRIKRPNQPTTLAARREQAEQRHAAMLAHAREANETAPAMLAPPPSRIPATPEQTAAAEALNVPPTACAALDITPDDAESLSKIPAEILPRALLMLQIWLDGAYYPDAMRLAGLSTAELMSARRRSPAYLELYHRVHAERMKHAAARVESVAERTAAGDWRLRDGYLPPDGRAQQLILQAHDEAYDPKQAAALPQVNIQINL